MHLLRCQVTHKPRLVRRLGLATTSLLCLVLRLRFRVCRRNGWRQQVLAGIASELRARLRRRARGRHLVLQVAKSPRRWRSRFLRQVGGRRATPRAARLTTAGDGRAAAHREKVARARRGRRCMARKRRHIPPVRHALAAERPRARHERTRRLTRYSLFVKETRLDAFWARDGTHKAVERALLNKGVDQLGTAATGLVAQDGVIRIRVRAGVRCGTRPRLQHMIRA